MIPSLHEFLFAVAPLAALTNPIAEMPVFLSIVEGRTTRGQTAAAMEVGLGVLVVLTIAVLVGQPALTSLGISIPAFRAAGGLLLVTMGLEMSRGDEPALQTATTGVAGVDDRLWVPFVMPMLAGPGAIVTAISLSFREVELRPMPLATLAAVVMCSVMVLLVLMAAPLVMRRSTTRTRRIMTRFSGLLLVAIGFQMGFTGIAEFFGIEVGA